MRTSILILLGCFSFIACSQVNIIEEQPLLLANAYQIVRDKTPNKDYLEAALLVMIDISNQPSESNIKLAIQILQKTAKVELAHSYWFQWVHYGRHAISLQEQLDKYQLGEKISLIELHRKTHMLFRELLSDIEQKRKSLPKNYQSYGSESGLLD